MARHLSTGDHDEHRDALNPKALGDHRVVIDVDADDLELAVELLRELRHQR